MPITASPLASVVPDLGARVLGRLANAELVFFGATVFGMLRDAPVSIGFGAGSVQSRRKQFVCSADDLEAVAGGVQVGAACTLGTADWQVAVRTEHPQSGLVTLELERA